MREPLFKEAVASANRIRINYKLSYPIDVISIIEAEGINVISKVYPIDFDGCYLAIGKTNPTIILNTNHAIPEGRIRYTACHELYHHILNLEKKSLGVDMFEDNDSNKPLIERACDVFSANLLMPEDAVIDVFFEHVFQLGDPAKILCEKFIVSKQAMEIRLKELDLQYIPPLR